MSDMVLSEGRRDGDTVFVSLWYPGVGDNATRLQVGLTHVRAADDIRISYDFDRDGWKVEQEIYGRQDGNRLSTPTGEWIEAAFIPAWQFRAADVSDESP